MSENKIFNEPFCVLILTHGRANNVITHRTLRKLGYTGPIYLVIDNTDKQKDEYISTYGKNVVIFDKEKAIDGTDTGDNFRRKNAVVYARNECNRIAQSLGFKYYLVLDDDYSSFEFRFDGENYCYKQLKYLDDAFSAVFRFLKNTKTTCIALAQGGGFIGGSESAFAKKIKLTRKLMNSFFCSTEKDFKFFGTINEDVNCYVLNGSKGDIYFTTNFISLNQAQTQKNAGGLTDIYLNLGTYVKSFYSVIFSPSSVKVSTMGNTDRRVHHKVLWDYAVPKILNEKHSRKK